MDSLHLVAGMDSLHLAVAALPHLVARQRQKILQNLTDKMLRITHVRMPKLVLAVTAVSLQSAVVVVSQL
jgi:hypothetical protein